jgi:hypothetical protein
VVTLRQAWKRLDPIVSQVNRLQRATADAVDVACQR